jgi:hypothetical protein
VYRSEEQMVEQLVAWLRGMGLIVQRSVHVRRLELDVVALGCIDIVSAKPAKNCTDMLYVFEAKLAASHMLARDVVEQAITRLFIADYVYIAVPKTANVWINDKEQKVVEVPRIIEKLAQGSYSKKIGIIAMEPNNGVEIVREAIRSALVVDELKKEVLKELKKTQKTLWRFIN